MKSRRPKSRDGLNARGSSRIQRERHTVGERADSNTLPGNDDMIATLLHKRSSFLTRRRQIVSVPVRLAKQAFECLTSQNRRRTLRLTAPWNAIGHESAFPCRPVWNGLAEGFAFWTRSRASRGLRTKSVDSIVPEADLGRSELLRTAAALCGHWAGVAPVASIV